VLAAAAINSEGAPAAGGHTPASIARLPPKLRKRLLERGILKEQDVEGCEAGGAVAGASKGDSDVGPAEVPQPAESSAVPVAPLASPASPGGLGTPPDVPNRPPSPVSSAEAAVSLSAALSKALSVPHAALGRHAPVPAAVSKAPPVAAMSKSASLMSPSAPAALSKAQSLAPRACAASPEPFMLPVVPSCAAAASTPKVAPPAIQASVAKQLPSPAAPQRSVYSSGPQLRAEASSKRGAEPVADEPPAKRQNQPEPEPAVVAARHTAPAVEAAVSADSMAGRREIASERRGDASRGKSASEGAFEAASGGSPVAPAPCGGAACSGCPAPAPAPPAEAPPDGPPLPAGWVRVPHEGDYYYWNTSTSEVSWEHPAGPQVEPEKPVFTEEHRILQTDLGKIIGRQGINLKIIKASIGCNVNVPRQGKGKDGKGKGDGKGKDKGKGKGKPTLEKGEGRGIGTGDKPLTDDKFVVVKVTADTPLKARGGKRCLEVMLGYGRSVERALAELGVEVKLPPLEDELKAAGMKSKDGIDPMDPAAYSDAPVGQWSSGMKKGSRNGQRGPGGSDAKTENAERF